MRPRIRKEEFTPKSHTFILDRIFRHAVKIEIRGPSYRQHLGREFQKKYEKHQEIYLTTAYLPNHISNRQFIVDFEKVVDFIMEMKIPL